MNLFDRSASALAQANAEIARLTQALDTERARYDTLVAEVIQLRRDGFVQPVKPAQVLEVQIGTTDPVDAVIEEYAGKFPGSRRDLEIFAAKENALGKTKEQIVAAIQKGGQHWDDDA